MVRNDYSKEQRDEWQRNRIRDEIASGRITPTENINRFLAGKPPLKSKSKDAFADLNEQINKSLKEQTSQAEQKQKAFRRGGLQWLGDSTCFSDLYYSRADGGVWATFWKGGGTYFYPLSRSEAADWFDDGSAGGWFNESGLR